MIMSKKTFDIKKVLLLMLVSGALLAFPGHPFFLINTGPGSDLTFRLSPEAAIAANMYDDLKTVTYAGVTLDPVYYYEAADATGTVWADSSSAGAEELDITGAGADPTIDQLSPIPGTESILFNSADVYEADTSASGDLPDSRDFLFEFVFKTDDLGATQRTLFGKYDGASNHYFCFHNTASIVCQVGGVGPIRCLNAAATADTWYMVHWFGDRSGNSTCYANAIPETTVAISGAASASNANTLVIGGLDTSNQKSDSNIEHAALWICPSGTPGCLATNSTDADSNGIADWTDIARKRLLQLNGLWPVTGGGTMWASAVARASSAYTSVQLTDGGARTMFLVGAGWPRMQKTFKTTASSGALVEPDSTNSFTYSEQIDHANWNKYQATVAANSVAFLNGDLTAEKITLSSTGLSQLDQSVSLSGYNALSIFGKPINASWVYLYIYTSEEHSCFFNATTMTVGSCAGGAHGYIEDYGGGWARMCLVTGNVTNGTATTAFLISEGNGDADWSSAPGDAMYFSGAQIEKGIERCTSYIPTTTAAATRQYDYIELQSSASILGASGSIYSEIVYASGALIDNVTAGDTRPIYYIHNAGADPYNIATLNTSESITSVGYATSEQWSIAGTTVVNTGAVTTNRVKYQADDVDFLIGGSSEGTDSSSTFATGADQIYIGSLSTAGDQLNGQINEIQIYSTYTDEVN